jgi:hypothetical protein
VSASKESPASPAAGWAPNSFCLAAERSEDTVLETRAGLMRDFVFEAMGPVESDAAAVRLCLKHNDDAGARYHLKRVVECVKAAASTFRELETLTGRAG